MATGVVQRNWNSYKTEVEICMIIRDFDYYFLNENVRGLKKDVALKVYAYWKPPAALQWVLKCVTETVYYQNCPFVTKMNLQCELEDAPAIALKFEVCNSYLNIMSTLGTVETTLNTVLKAKSRGAILVVPLIVNAVTGLLSHDAAKTGELFVRGEILRFSETGVLGQFGLEIFGGGTKRPFRLEVSKLNPDSLFDIPYPYTLVYKTEEIHYDDVSSKRGYWNLSSTTLAKVANENYNRVLKFELYERYHNEAYGFSLTTLKKIFVENEIEYPITQNKDGKMSKKYSLKFLRMQQTLQNSLPYYMKRGLQFKRIYAVDFSVSNWNTRLHGQPLHEPMNGKFTPYEEALQAVASVFGRVTQTESNFYSFGNAKMEPYMANFEDFGHMKSLLANYAQAICAAKLSACRLTEEELANACGPNLKSCKMGGGAELGALLRNILSTITYGKSPNTKQDLQYYVCFIFTDGVFSDIDDAMKLIIHLAKLPVSLVFIAVGMGDFTQPLKLETDWTHPVTGEYPSRKITSIIHYRSQLKWESAIKFSDRFTTKPMELFEKELFTNIEEQTLKFVRAFAPNY